MSEDSKKNLDKKDSCKDNIILSEDISAKKCFLYKDNTWKYIVGISVPLIIIIFCGMLTISSKVNKQKLVSNYAQSVTTFLADLSKVELNVMPVNTEELFTKSLKNRERISMMIDRFDNIKNSEIPKGFEKIHLKIEDFNKTCLELSEFSRDREDWLYRSIQALNSENVESIGNILNENKVKSPIFLKTLEARAEIMLEEIIKDLNIELSKYK